MKIKMFEPSDYPIIESWFIERGLTAPSVDLISDVGFITENACGFLYLTNSKVGILDCFITDPNSKNSDRKRSLDYITQLLIDYAKKSGVRLLKGDTQLDTILELSRSFKFKEIGQYTVFQKELSWVQ